MKVAPGAITLTGFPLGQRFRCEKQDADSYNTTSLQQKIPMTSGYSNTLEFSSAARKEFERIAALLGLDDWMMAIGFSGRLALQFAEQHVKGKTEIAHVTPELEKLLTSNSEFFEALCEEGVLEWLTPLVLTKSAASSHG